MRQHLTRERVWIARPVLTDIFARAKDKAPLETGGMLLGYEGVDPCELVVTQTIEAGPNAVEQKEAFAPNGPWQREELAAVYASSGRITTYLGDWHSHPAGTALPSPKDLRTAKRVARSRAARASRPLTIILMCDDEKGWLAAAYRYSRWRLRPVKLEPFKEESTPI